MEMNQRINEKIAEAYRDFHLPRYQEIPDVGLYLVQAAKYINSSLMPLGDGMLTGSMISNYVKKGLIGNPVKKQYSRDQIAYLIFIAICKSVLSLDALSTFLKIQQDTYTVQRAYDYFVREFESLLLFTFDLTDTAEMFPDTNSDEKRLISTCIIAAVQKVYLEKYLEELSRENP